MLLLRYPIRRGGRDLCNLVIHQTEIVLSASVSTAPERVSAASTEEARSGANLRHEGSGDLAEKPGTWDEFKILFEPRSKSSVVGRCAVLLYAVLLFAMQHAPMLTLLLVPCCRWDWHAWQFFCALLTPAGDAASCLTSLESAVCQLSTCPPDCGGSRHALFTWSSVKMYLQLSGSCWSAPLPP